MCYIKHFIPLHKEIAIQSIRNRPRFKIKTKMSKADFTKKLEKQFQLQNKILGGYISSHISIIRVRKEKKKYWSPQLEIRTEKDEYNPDITVIRGMFVPRAAVWTFFMFLYILGASSFLIFGMIWFVQNNLNEKSNLDILFWLSGLLLIITYISAKVGQILSKDQIKVLKNFMEKVVEEDVEVLK